MPTRTQQLANLISDGAEAARETKRMERWIDLVSICIFLSVPQGDQIVFFFEKNVLTNN
jgi:hypothetical protein